jgi:hypothetical protein
MKHKVMALVCAQLLQYQRQLGTSISLMNFLNETRPLYLHSAARTVQQGLVEEELLSILRLSGVNALMLKGSAIASEVYGNSTSRTSSDLDVLIRISDVARVNAILLGAGYRKLEPLPLAYCDEKLRHVAYQHDKTQTVVEIHWDFGLPGFFRLSSEEIWSEIMTNDSGWLKMSPQMTLIHLLINHHVHAFRRLRTVVDILWCLHKYENEIGWLSFVEHLQSIGLIKTTSITLSQIRDLWGQFDIDMPCIESFDQKIASTGIRRPQRLTWYFRIDLWKDYVSSTFWDKLIGRLALDSILTVSRSYLKVFFPIPGAIQALYKDERKWMLPLNYMRFAVWRIRQWISLQRVRG